MLIAATFLGVLFIFLALALIALAVCAFDDSVPRIHEREKTGLLHANHHS